MNEYNKMIKVFWFVFLFAVFVYVFVAYKASPEIILDLTYLQYIGFILKFLGVSVLPLASTLFLEKHKRKLVEVNNSYFVIFLVQLALAEFISVAGISFFFADKIFIQMLPFSLMSLMMILYLKPKNRAI